MPRVPTGNPPGRPPSVKGKVWTDAIRKAVLRDKHVKGLAHALVRKGLDGDISALKEIGDRLEGKVAQRVEGQDGGAIKVQMIKGDDTV